jgi:hypothetical protein
MRLARWVTQADDPMAHPVDSASLPRPVVWVASGVTPVGNPTAGLAGRVCR